DWRHRSPRCEPCSPGQNAPRRRGTRPRKPGRRIRSEPHARAAPTPARGPQRALLPASRRQLYRALGASPSVRRVVLPVRHYNISLRAPGAGLPQQRGSVTAVEFVFPKWGLTRSEALIVRWLCARGDAVAVDQPLVEVETEKASAEVPAPSAGIVARIVAEIG